MNHSFLTSEYKSFPFYRREMSDSMRKRIISEIPKGISSVEDFVEKLKKIIQEHSGLTWDDIASTSRKQHVVEYRHLFCKIMKDVFKRAVSLKQIGDMIRPGYDHASVLHGCKQIENFISTDKQFKKIYDNLIRDL